MDTQKEYIAQCSLVLSLFLTRSVFLIAWDRVIVNIRAVISHRFVTQRRFHNSGDVHCMSLCDVSMRRMPIARIKRIDMCACYVFTSNRHSHSHRGTFSPRASHRFYRHNAMLYISLFHVILFVHCICTTLQNE